MKEDSKWPLGSYIACIIGAATVLILKLHVAQMGGSHFSGGRLLPILLALSPFLFAVLVINFDENPRALKFLSLAIIIQTIAAIVAYCQAIFRETGLEGNLDIGLIPLYQFAFLGLAATAVRFLNEKKERKN